MTTGVRIVERDFEAAAFDGQGAARFGGRWNPPGRAVVYASSSESLAILETLVHLRRLASLPHFVLFELAFDAALVTRIDRAALPVGWQRSDPQPALQSIGRDWLARGGSAILAVPSAIVQAESNYLLNPAHPDFKRIIIRPTRPCIIDPRLLPG